MLFGGQAPPRPAEGAYSAPPVPDRLAALHFQTKNLPNVIWRPGSAQTRWGSLQRSPRPLAALHFQTKNAPNVVWRPALPGPAGELTAPSDTLAALKLLTPLAFDPQRCGASPHAFSVWRQSVPVLLFSNSNTELTYWAQFLDGGWSNINAKLCL